MSFAPVLKVPEFLFELKAPLVAFDHSYILITIFYHLLSDD